MDFVGPLGLLARPKRFSEGFSVRVASEEVAIKVYKMASKAVNSSEEPAERSQSPFCLFAIACLPQILQVMYNLPPLHVGA